MCLCCYTESQAFINCEKTDMDKVTSNINQQMHLYNFHLKHFKPLRHVSIFSDHHQGVSSFLAKVITYSRFSSFL